MTDKKSPLTPKPLATKPTIADCNARIDALTRRLCWLDQQASSSSTNVSIIWLLISVIIIVLVVFGINVFQYGW